MISPAPSLGTLFRLWLILGAQSFGGGAATLALIRQAVVDRHGWISEAEFSRDWALCRITPGINLLGLTILLGRRLAGIPGIALCLAGLLLPSVAITLLMTACYAQFRHLPAMQSALKGIIPGTVGVGLLTAYQLGKPLLTEARQEGQGSFTVSAALLVGSGLAVAVWHLPVVLVLCAAGSLSAAWNWYVSRNAKKHKDLKREG